MKPFAEACEQNKWPILAVLQEVFAQTHQVLELGSGTGQHAVHFARHLPHLVWHTSDLAPSHAGIRLWLEEAALANVRAPLCLDVRDPHWPVATVDGVFSANVLHIISWPSVIALFRGIGRVLDVGGLLGIYGPFNYAGAYTSESNARFDAWLRDRDPDSGVRNFEDVDALARAEGLALIGDYAMPVNNRTLIWRRQTR